MPLWCSTEQVWLLTQLYSIDFSQSGITKKCVFNRRTIKVCVSYYWRCPGNSALTPDGVLVSEVLKATHEARRGPMKGAVSTQKALQGSETETRELLGGTTENSVSPMRGHWFALLANQSFFIKRKQKKIELVARPGTRRMAAAADSPIKRDIVALLCPSSYIWLFFEGHFWRKIFYYLAVRKSMLNS